MKLTVCLFFAFTTLLVLASDTHAAFVVAADLDPSPASQSLHPNFNFGGDTTAASESAPSLAVGLPPHDSLFGGNGMTLPDTYVVSYTPGSDTDNFAPSPGTLLGSTTGFGSETASGIVGGSTGFYNVYITGPDTVGISSTSTVTASGNGTPITLGPLDLNNGGTGVDLDPGTTFVGGFNNAWFKVGTVALTAGNTYTLTLQASNNTFLSQRLAGVMWERVEVPEPGTATLIALASCLLCVRFGNRYEYCTHT